VSDWQDRFRDDIEVEEGSEGEEWVLWSPQVREVDGVIDLTEEGDGDGGGAGALGDDDSGVEYCESDDVVFIEDDDGTIDLT
jgi:hypothetical protein